VEVPHPWMVVLVQCLAAVPLTLLANVRLKLIKPIRTSHLPKASLLAVLFTLCLTSSLLGLARVHVPMVVVGKNLAPFCTGLLEAIVWGDSLSLRSLGALLLGVAGSALYALGDASTEPVGVLIILANSILVAVTAVTEKHVVGTLDQSALGLSLYRNSLALPLLAIAFTVGLDDFTDAGQAVAQASDGCLFALALSSVFSSLAGVLIFTLQGRVRATTTQIAGLCYKLATTLLSLACFPQSRHDIGGVAVLGYALSTFGVTLYIWPHDASHVKIAATLASRGPLLDSTGGPPDSSASTSAGSRLRAARTRGRTAGRMMGAIAEESGDQRSPHDSSEAEDLILI